MIDIVELVIIISLILFQSIFGIGLLLFGTPTFILLDYSFPETLSLLLPISLVISFLQFTLSKEKDLNFIFNFNLFCIPFLLLSLYFILYNYKIIDFKFYTSLIIIFFSSISLLKDKLKLKKKINNFEKKIILMIIGIIHGLTNLGGSLLIIFSTHMSKQNKDLSRYYISYGYFIMSIFQISVLFFLKKNSFDINNIYYLFIIFLLYFPIQKLFRNFDNTKFSKIINIIALIYGVGIFTNIIFN